MQTIDASLFSPYENAFLARENLSKYAFSLCGGPCAGMIRIDSGEMLEAVLQKAILANIPYKVLGGMTNILICDQGFDGLVLLNRKGIITHIVKDDGVVELTADSGVGMAAVVRYCIDHSISGMEWAAGLPGTVGGAVCGNAGAFGTETADIFISGTVFGEAGEKYEISPEQMHYAYRSSALKGQEKQVLLTASFALHTGVRAQIESLGNEYREKRRTNQPVDEHSLGSVFKNPPGYFAAKLIQDAGLKGYSIGKATVSMKHALYITTTEGVTAADYYRLVCYVQDEVFHQFGILLEPEIELFGFGAV